jgi:hypothetical protein
MFLGEAQKGVRERLTREGRSWHAVIVCSTTNRVVTGVTMRRKVLTSSPAWSGCRRRAGLGRVEGQVLGDQGPVRKCRAAVPAAAGVLGPPAAPGAVRR